MPKTTSNMIAAQLTLPSGVHLMGFPSLKNDAPAVTAATNLQAQVAALLAVTECQFRVLALLEPLTKLIPNMAQPSPAALQDFERAAVELQPCFAMTTAPVLLPFLRDLLCLQIESLTNVRESLQAVLSGGAGRGSAHIQALLSRYPPVVDLLDLARAFYLIAGIDLPAAPELSANTDPAALRQSVRSIDGLIQSLVTIADALGGC